jgi:hypothetical protein
MNQKGITEIEFALFLFFLTLSLVSFIKIDQHLSKVEQRDLHEFERNWNTFTPANVQRIYGQKE